MQKKASGSPEAFVMHKEKPTMQLLVATLAVGAVEQQRPGALHRGVLHW
jgi:hypothetical protein